jgi:hypothetical protein
VGKAVTTFVGTGTQGGGQETTHLVCERLSYALPLHQALGRASISKHACLGAASCCVCVPIASCLGDSLLHAALSSVDGVNRKDDFLASVS